MSPRLPDNWTTLNVREYFGLRGDYSTNLRLKRPKKTKYIYAEWLPEESEDPRPHQGRTKGGKGKRITLNESMRTEDPLEGAKRAVAWNQTKQKEVRDKKDQQEGKFDNPLLHYWEQYWFQEEPLRETKRNFKRWRREEQRKWNAPEYGISQQPWSQRSVDLITPSDFREYFDLLEKRARAKGTNGAETKKEMKTLINKLLRIAQDDFLGHSFPTFPRIESGKRDQVRHLQRKEFDLLMQTVSDLAEGAVQKATTPKKYQSLPFKPSNRNNVRNWVDLHDALFLMWFFYLRPEDMCRLRSEWFEESPEEWICNLETTKKDRYRHRTTHYREDAPKFLKRIFGRKPTGFTILPHMQRDMHNPASSGVLGNLNFLLKHAIDLCLPDFPVKERKWMTLRHTALRLTLEDDRDLWIPPDINSFAENAHTSPQMLRETYINYIESESTAKKSRKKIKSGNWSLQRGRISDQIN